MRRIVIFVEKHHEAVLSAALLSAAGMAGGDAYNYVKSHLTQRGVRHGQAAHEDHVPSGHVLCVFVV